MKARKHYASHYSFNLNIYRFTCRVHSYSGTLDFIIQLEKWTTSISPQEKMATFQFQTMQLCNVLMFYSTCLIPPNLRSPTLYLVDWLIKACPPFWSSSLTNYRDLFTSIVRGSAVSTSSRKPVVTSVCNISYPRV